MVCVNIHLQKYISGMFYVDIHLQKDISSMFYVNIHLQKDIICWFLRLSNGMQARSR